MKRKDWGRIVREHSLYTLRIKTGLLYLVVLLGLLLDFTPGLHKSWTHKSTWEKRRNLTRKTEKKSRWPLLLHGFSFLSSWLISCPHMQEIKFIYSTCITKKRQRREWYRFWFPKTVWLSQQINRRRRERSRCSFRLSIFQFFASKVGDKREEKGEEGRPTQVSWERETNNGSLWVRLWLSRSQSWLIVNM